MLNLCDNLGCMNSVSVLYMLFPCMICEFSVYICCFFYVLCMPMHNGVLECVDIVMCMCLLHNY